MFHLYMGQEVLSAEEMVAYNIGFDLLKYDCTLELKPDQGSSIRSDPQPSPSVRRNRQKTNDRPRSLQSQGNQSEVLDLN